MAVENLLARLAGECNWSTETRSGGFGGLSHSDIAYCMGGLSIPAYAYCRIKYLHDVSSVPALLKWAVENTPPNKRRFALARLAILESITPRKCGSCEGKGISYHEQGIIKTCPRCHGTGSKSFSNSERARLIDVDKSGYTGECLGWIVRYVSI